MSKLICAQKHVRRFEPRIDREVWKCQKCGREMVAAMWDGKQYVPYKTDRQKAAGG